MGGTYVNDFIDRGRVKKVYVQADAKFRMLPEDVDKLYVRSANGEMVPFSAFTTSHWVYGSPRLERYNGLPSMEIQGSRARNQFRRCYGVDGKPCVKITGGHWL